MEIRKSKQTATRAACNTLLYTHQLALLVRRLGLCSGNYALVLPSPPVTTGRWPQVHTGVAPVHNIGSALAGRSGLQHSTALYLVFVCLLQFVLIEALHAEYLERF
eukprot:1148318-Pelagomonas_calceolata.AAC.2